MKDLKNKEKTFIQKNVHPSDDPTIQMETFTDQNV